MRDMSMPELEMPAKRSLMDEGRSFSLSLSFLRWRLDAERSLAPSLFLLLRVDLDDLCGLPSRSLSRSSLGFLSDLERCCFSRGWSS